MIGKIRVLITTVLKRAISGTKSIVALIGKYTFVFLAFSIIRISMFFIKRTKPKTSHA